VKDAIDALRDRIGTVQQIKTTLTAIDTTTMKARGELDALRTAIDSTAEKARDELDALRSAIVTEIDRIEEQVRASSAAAHGR